LRQVRIPGRSGDQATTIAMGHAPRIWNTTPRRPFFRRGKTSRVRRHGF
jgi:hypothetical protein